MNKFLITGANGFVGSHLRQFLEQNGKSVFGLDKVTSTEEIFECDILDKAKLLKVIKEVKPDAIIHLAAQSSVEKSWKEPELTKRINVDGTKNLFDCVLESKITPRILIVSSGEVYGTTKEIPFKETSSLNPDNPYSESRLAQEKLVADYFKKFRMDVIISRSFPHTGPGQSSSFVCSSFARQIAEIEQGKKHLIEVGNLDAKRDFTDVRDIVKAYLLAIEKCTSGEIYNICSGKALSIKSILDTLVGLSGTEVKIKKDPKRSRPSDIPILVGDNSKFLKQTGWKPEIDFKQTLRGLLDYWRENI